MLNADQTEIEKYFRNKTLPRNLTLSARQTDLAPFYEKASLLLNLSRPDEWVETFGLTIVEAMAFGIPVIVPPVGGPAEIVSEGVEGYRLSAYETEKIAARIRELAQDPDLCLRLSRAAKKRPRDFGEEVFERKMLEVLCG